MKSRIVYSSPIFLSGHMYLSLVLPGTRWRNVHHVPSPCLQVLCNKDRQNYRYGEDNGNDSDSYIRQHIIYIIMHT